MYSSPRSIRCFIVRIDDGNDFARNGVLKVAGRVAGDATSLLPSSGIFSCSAGSCGARLFSAAGCAGCVDAGGRVCGASVAVLVGVRRPGWRRARAAGSRLPAFRGAMDGVLDRGRHRCVSAGARTRVWWAAIDAASHGLVRRFVAVLLGVAGGHLHQPGVPGGAARQRPSRRARRYFRFRWRVVGARCGRSWLGARGCLLRRSLGAGGGGRARPPGPHSFRRAAA